MRQTIRRRTGVLGLVFMCGLFASQALAQKPPAKPVPSAPLKAYKGPETEVVVMVEVNDGKQMLVHFKGLGGDLEGKTLLYLLEDQGNGNKTVYIDKKRGSKTYRSVMLDARDNHWQFYHPTNFKNQFGLSFSEEQSGKIKVDDVLAAYKP
jgi:hypothetical protein